MITENIYGEQWSALSSAEIDDCLLELANVVAGEFLSRLDGEKARHELSLPELVFDEEDIMGAAKGEMQELFLEAEGIPFKVSIHIEGQEAAPP